VFWVLDDLYFGVCDEWFGLIWRGCMLLFVLWVFMVIDVDFFVWCVGYEGAVL